MQTMKLPILLGLVLTVCSCASAPRCAGGPYDLGQFMDNLITDEGSRPISSYFDFHIEAGASVPLIMSYGSKRLAATIRTHNPREDGSNHVTTLTLLGGDCIPWRNFIEEHEASVVQEPSQPPVLPVGQIKRGRMVIDIARGGAAGYCVHDIVIVRNRYAGKT